MRSELTSVRIDRLEKIILLSQAHNEKIIPYKPGGFKCY
jgi:hypothetical protein